MNEFQELHAVALELAARAGSLLRERADKVRELVDTKSTPTDMVTEVDRAAEALIVAYLAEKRPNDSILGEESGAHAGTSGVRWLVDPLDGTTNYVYGYPAYAVSVAAELDGTVVVGVVYDASRDETFEAYQGGGARRRGRPIRVSEQPEFARALIGTGFAYDPLRRQRQGQTLAALVPVIRDIRRSGSAALDLCHVACGWLDGYYEFGLNPWDYAAGRLLIEEAGGTSDWVDSGLEGLPILIAGNQTVVDGLRRELQRSSGQ